MSTRNSSSAEPDWVHLSGKGTHSVHDVRSLSYDMSECSEAGVKSFPVFQTPHWPHPVSAHRCCPTHMHTHMCSSRTDKLYLVWSKHEIWNQRDRQSLALTKSGNLPEIISIHPPAGYREDNFLKFDVFFFFNISEHRHT